MIHSLLGTREITQLPLKKPAPFAVGGGS
jgi:hypothetical protein